MEMMIDFLVRLITPMEGVDYALAPLVLSALTQVPGLIKGISASNAAVAQGEKDKARALRDQKAAQRALANLREGKLEFEPVKDKLASRQTDAYEMAMSRAPEQAARQAREMALASSLASGGDPRLQMVNMIAGQNFAGQAQKDALAGLSGRQRATQTLATQEQNIQDTNRERFRERFNTELDQGQKLFTSSRAQAEKAEDAIAEAKRAKKQAMIGAATGAITGAIGTPGVSKFGDIFKSIPGALSTVGPDLGGVGGSATTLNEVLSGTGAEYGGPQPSVQNIIDNADLNDFGGIEDFDMPEENFSMTGEFLDNLAQMAVGGKVGKTGGEFNHGTNKKALVDEESGEKEAELTGDETMFVFNPKQTSTFEKLVKGDDPVALMKFMKKLPKKPQFNR